MWNDLRIGWRLVVKDPGFTAATILVLAIGIAATNTVFTLVNGALLRNLPFDQPDRIVELGPVSYQDLQDFRAATRSFSAIAAADEQTMNVSDEDVAPERFTGAFVSANTFALLGRGPALGRDLQPDDERAGGAPVVILGDALWRSRYQAQPDIVGRAIRVNGVSAIVIGVMPEGFEFPLNAKLWQPLTLMRSDEIDNRRVRSLNGFGRLRDGATISQARSELASISATLERDFPDPERQVRVDRFRPGIGAPMVAVILAMQGAVTFVLLVACANAANLLLARAVSRSREISVRMSLGATRARIVRQLFMESVLLASIAGVVGLVLSAAGIQAFWHVVQQTGDPPPYWLTFPMDAQVFAFLAVICLGTAVLFGLAPALHTSRTNIVETLNAMEYRGGSSRQNLRWTGALVVAQLALTLVLLTGAGLMMRHLVAMARLDAGVDTTNIVRLRVDLPAPAYDTPEQRLAFHDQLEERLSTLPGMAASIATIIPMAGGIVREVLVEGAGEPFRDERLTASVVTIGRRYFEMLQAGPVRGREFEAGDGRPGRGAVVVNERFAAIHFPGQDALGRRVQLVAPGRPATASEWLPIIGVAPNVRQRTGDSTTRADDAASGRFDFDPVVYLPYMANPVPGLNILLRPEGSPALAAAAVLRDQVRAIDPDLPVFAITTVDAELVRLRWPQRVFGSMFAIFAIFALILAVVGLYGVMAYSVAQRTREIGVRVALGARARQIGWLVARGASAHLGAGLLLGAAGSLAVSRLVPAVLTGTTGADPVTLLTVAGLLVGAGLGASYIPARRAMRVDPAAALRAE